MLLTSVYPGATTPKTHGESTPLAGQLAHTLLWAGVLNWARTPGARSPNALSWGHAVSRARPSGKGRGCYGASRRSTASTLTPDGRPNRRVEIGYACVTPLLKGGLSRYTLGVYPGIRSY